MHVKHFFECNAIIFLQNFILNRKQYMYIYQRLKDIREDSDKKQEDIASVLNITRQQYQLYESGKREMPMHHFIVLAKYYNVSIDYLAGLTDTPRKSSK